MSESRKTVTEVSIPSNPNYLERLRRIMGCLADCAGMDTKEAHDAKLAVTEACANAIRHGSPEGGEDKVSIRISATVGTVVTEVTDRGGGFDPAKLVTKPISEPGGLGIPLMRALSDDLQFERNLKGMTVRLVKTAKSPSVNRRKR
jgi:serine/threonine-protein kinase RsbW